MANDVVQHAKKKSILPYVSDFQEILKEAILLVRDDKIRHNINRVLNIWQERNIYPTNFVDELRALLTGTSAHTSKIVAEYKLSSVIEKIKRVKKLENFTGQKISVVNQARIDKLSKDALNNLKDKSHGEQFSKDFDEATKYIEAVVSSLEKEIAARHDLLDYLQNTEIFYETQKGEAKIVATAYRNFAQRVKSVKKKLSESKISLPSPLPSPCADAPSPTNSDDGPQLPGSQSPRQNGKEVSSLDERLSNIMQGIPMVPKPEVIQQPQVEHNFGQNSSVPLPVALQAAIGIHSTPDSWHTIQPPPPPPPPPLPPIPPLLPNLGGSMVDLVMDSKYVRPPLLQPPPPPPPPHYPAALQQQLPQMSLYSTPYEYDYSHQLNPTSDAPETRDKVQAIQPVVSLRTEDLAAQYKQAPVSSQIYDGYMNSTAQQPHENFEPADMELGDSDEEDSHMRPQSQRFLKVIDTHTVQNDSRLSSAPQINSSMPYSDTDSRHNDDSHYPSQLSHHKNLPPRPVNRNVPQPRHHYAHKLDDRNSEPLDSRWPNTGRSNHYSGPGTRQWKPPHHNLRGAYNRRY